MLQRSFLPFTLVTAILMSGIVAAPARAADDNLSYARIVRLSYATGDVQLMRADASAKWEPAYANMPIQQGFTIGTNNGIAEVEFEHGSALWLSKNSVLQFTELALSDGGRITKVTLAQGTASFEAGIQTGDTFVVSTPKFQIAPVGKSGFRVDAIAGGGSVDVFTGRISLTSSAGTQDLAKGSALTFNASAPGQATIANSPSRDSWDRWVSDRENYLVNGANQTLQNTNSPYSYGTADLSSYGSWNYVSGCGYGWQPYGVSAGWMPFLDGQWMNYNGLGWTWVSFEPWGWMPYHFGGWSNCGSSWLWMPGENGFWNPGGVQWVGVGKRVGWRPLPPRNPRVNAPHPAASPVVVASKDLGKEGRYEVKTASRISESARELPSSPLANGKMPTAGNLASNSASGDRRGAGSVLVPTAPSLATLRSSMAGAGSPPRTIVNGAAPPSAPRASGPSGTMPATALANAAPPTARIPSAPPVRSFAHPPSQPGQASSRGSSGGSSSATSSGGGSRGSTGSASSAGSSSPGGGSRGGGGGASSAPAGGGGRPH